MRALVRADVMTTTGDLFDVQERIFSRLVLPAWMSSLVELAAKRIVLQPSKERS